MYTMVIMAMHNHQMITESCMMIVHCFNANHARVSVSLLRSCKHCTADLEAKAKLARCTVLLPIGKL